MKDKVEVLVDECRRCLAVGVDLRAPFIQVVLDVLEPVEPADPVTAAEKDSE